ncbi:hypothetical protein Bbelb_435020 [Branchiostoma belcheri]|nr:hypothetical protein Bbelb_435020 [Branchiostoma belcheri]
MGQPCRTPRDSRVLCVCGYWLKECHLHTSLNYSQSQHLPGRWREGRSAFTPLTLEAGDTRNRHKSSKSRPFWTVGTVGLGRFFHQPFDLALPYLLTGHNGIVHACVLRRKTNHHGVCVATEKRKPHEFLPFVLPLKFLLGHDTVESFNGHLLFDLSGVYLTKAPLTWKVKKVKVDHRLQDGGSPQMPTSTAGTGAGDTSQNLRNYRNNREIVRPYEQNDAV